MKVDILCDTPDSFMHEYLPDLVQDICSLGHTVSLETDQKHLTGGDFLFFISCRNIYEDKLLSRYTHPIVAHPSKLPWGRGSAAVAWEILNGSKELWVTLFKPVEKLDRGPILLQRSFSVEEFDLLNVIRYKQACVTFDLVIDLLKYPQNLNPLPQVGDSCFYKRRTARDSELDPQKSIADQFDLLRVVDNERYPAFFYFKGHKFTLKIFEDLSNEEP